MSRRAAALSASLALLAMPIAPVHADETKQGCVDAHAEGQQLRKDGKLLESGRVFRSCAQRGCPQVVQAECARWLAEVEEATPTVVFDAVDASGSTVTSVSVYVDDRLAAERLDGRALPVDPGEHNFAFVSRDGARSEQRVLVLEGDRNRKIRVRIASSTSPGNGASSTQTSAVQHDARTNLGRAESSPPWVVYPAGALGVLGVVGFVTFGVLGRAQQSKLDDCRGSCSDADYDVMRDRYIVADVSLLIGVVGLGAATIAWLTR